MYWNPIIFYCTIQDTEIESFYNLEWVNLLRCCITSPSFLFLIIFGHTKHTSPSFVQCPRYVQQFYILFNTKNIVCIENTINKHVKRVSNISMNHSFESRYASIQKSQSFTNHFKSREKVKYLGDSFPDGWSEFGCGYVVE